MRFSIKLMVVLISAIGIACNSGNSYEQSKEDIYKKEKESPLQFITISKNSKRNLLGQTVVRAVVKNNASVCTYENIRIKLLYYDSEGREVENHEDVVKQPLAANTQVNFTARYFTPKGTDSVAVSIMGADALKQGEHK